ncbi:protein FAM111A-like [Sebastes umbrosus]|uniref:protein FAM111A-like n=1 Tax=Sebastes umbrosus TaxID=72105 RepID=UPI00189E0527|nr:protein FAM111A-like [Sebastes umbrosus]
MPCIVLSDSPGTMDQERGGATGPQIVTRSRGRVKEERDGDSTAGHLHRFPVKFSSTEPNEYTIDFDQPCTVLEAIKSDENFKKKMNCSDKNIMIQLGKEDKNYIFATHFPCSCIRRGASLILSYKSEQVETVQDQQDKTIQPRDEYSVFYIETVGGLDTKTKKPFRNNAVKKFKYLCDYGEKGMTVEEALKRDGRFIDDLSNFIENFTKIYEELHQQFPRLKELMESRVLANYYHYHTK